MPTNIEWTDETWNPITGCQKVSPGCKNCYMYRTYPRLKAMGQASYQKTPDQVTLVSNLLNKPLEWKRPRRVFVCSMSDLFQDDVPDGFIYDVFLTMAAAPQHTFQVLTKRPERVAALVRSFQCAIKDDLAMFKHAPAPWPLPNVWIGTSVESQEYTSRLDHLAEVPAAVRFVSYEPALGPVDFSPWLGLCQPGTRPSECGTHEQTLDWVIAGGESGPGARPAHPGWFRTVRDQCQAAGVPFFFKQWGEWFPVDTDAQREYWKNAITRKTVRERTKVWDGGEVSLRIGKASAGALLDGREWREFPEIRAP